MNTERKQSKILVIIPAFNEAQVIADTVSEVRAALAQADILVVDDGSSDATARCAAESGAMVVSTVFNVGIGGAVQTGFCFARRYGYDYALQIDGDGQHVAAYAPRLLDEIQKNKYDIVIGSRFVAASAGFRSSFVRRIGILFFARLLSALTGFRVTDPTSGFRAYGAKAILLFERCYPQDFPEPEAVMIARRYGLTVAEIPVEMRRRASGHSSIRYLATLYYMIKVTAAIMLHVLKKNRKISGINA